MHRSPSGAASRRAALLTLLAALAPLAAVRPTHAQRATLERLVRRDTLANGFQVVVVENHAVPLATLVLVVRSGAVTQGEGEEGVAHLFEHLLFAGYHGRDERTFNADAGALNARWNGTTGEETVSYYLTLPSAATRGGMQLLAQLVRSPLIDRAALEKERQVVMGELQRDVSNADFYLRDAVERRLWTTAFGRKNTVGNAGAILGVDPARLRALFETYYVPNNAALVVTGDVGAAEVLAAARELFGGWKRRPDPFAAHPVPPVPALEQHSGVRVVHADARGVTLLSELQGPSVTADPDDVYAADLFDELVNDPGSGMRQRLVDSGLFDSLSVSYSALAHTGPIVIYGRTTRERLRPALGALKREILHSGDEGYFAPEEITYAKRRIAVRQAFALERPSLLAHTIGYWWGVAGLDRFLQYREGLAAGTAADLRAYARRYLVMQPQAVGVLVGPEDAAGEPDELAEYLSVPRVP
jgi:zinc protease